MVDYKGYIRLDDIEAAKFYTNGRLTDTPVENLYIFIADKDIYCYLEDTYRRVDYPVIESSWSGIIKPRNTELRAAIDMLLDTKSTVKLITGTWGTGKAQPVDTILPTPNGNKLAGDIKAGDYLFDALGKPTKVLNVFPQGKLDVYKITFADGRTTLCGPEHLWYVRTKRGKNTKYNTITTLEMYNKGVKNNTSYNFCIPLCKAVEYLEKEYSIHPYVIGAFLGDGCCTSTPLAFSSKDEEIVNKISGLIGAKGYSKNPNNYSWYFIDSFTSDDKRKLIHTKTLFKDYPEICVTAEFKKIPKEYLYGSIEQRLDLLRGLLDTDGSIRNKGKVTFTSISEQLVNDIRELAWSLGFSASKIKTIRRNNHPEYTINFSIPVELKSSVFNLTRKKILAEKNLEHRYINKCQAHTISIRNIEKLNYQTDMVCFYVDNTLHLYLTNNYIVTHNTMLLAAAAIKQLEDEKIDKIVFIRNNILVKDTDNIGALPGDEFDKIKPYVGPLADHCGGFDGIELLILKKQLEVIPLGFLRGRSIRNAIILCTESENLTKEHIQLLLGRVDAGSSIWFDADTRQRDRVAFEKSKGIETMIERLSGEPLFSYVHLVTSERSATAKLADKLNN